MESVLRVILKVLTKTANVHLVFITIMESVNATCVIMIGIMIIGMCVLRIVDSNPACAVYASLCETRYYYDYYG